MDALRIKRLTPFFMAFFIWAHTASGHEIKVVSLAPNITEILFAIGLDEKNIIGITNYCDYPKETQKILKIGSLTTVNTEKILSLGPDYVFSVGAEGNPLNSGLKSAGLNVVALNAESIDDIFSNILAVGGLVGKEEAAQALVDRMKARLGVINEKTKNIKIRKKVYCEIWDDPLTSCGKGSLVDEVITRAGAINITGTINMLYPMINQEFIIKEDPDFIILGYMSRNQKNTQNATAKRIGWQEVSAVRNKNIIAGIDPNIFLRPGPRIVDGIEKIHERIYGAVGAGSAPTQDEIARKIFFLRLIRILLAIVAGAGLAICGTVFQALLRNPLAEPYILGISSGAGLGAVLFAALAGTVIFLPIPAFIGAAATIFLVYNLSRFGGKIPIQDLLLAGVVINIIFSSLILFLMATARNPVLHDAMWWLLGNLQIFDIKLLAAVSIMTICGIIIFFFYSRELDAISIGEEEALHLGIDTERVKGILFVVTSLVTAGLVSACGLIGFAGLIVPHIARSLVGPTHRRLLPASAILGALFLVISDILARTVMPPIEIPIGVVTALLGGPFFLFLLRKSRRLKQR
ncbi:MAG: iron chelate uptake ABC transporter family permease subunit [Candidatus Omnitrophica bacterium]|nr:iron chelate uptake ABC transporter family permease subunit [Candidatus Omnitrophota bacterium]